MATAPATAATGAGHARILVVDFGGQYTQLIARRVREAGVYSEILPYDAPATAFREFKPAGLILSGGPKSVSEDGAPWCDPALYTMGVPVLGVCYGMQLMTAALGGEVRRSGHREFGHAAVRVDRSRPSRLFERVPDDLRVWASHGDDVGAVPPGFTVAATSPARAVGMAALGAQEFPTRPATSSAGAAVGAAAVADSDEPGSTGRLSPVQAAIPAMEIRATQALEVDANRAFIVSLPFIVVADVGPGPTGRGRR